MPIPPRLSKNQFGSIVSHPLHYSFIFFPSLRCQKKSHSEGQVCLFKKGIGFPDDISIMNLHFLP
jgi:hypothetical protein